MEFSDGLFTDCSQEKSASMYMCKYLNFVLEDDVNDQFLNLYAGKQCQLYRVIIHVYASFTPPLLNFINLLAFLPLMPDIL